MAEQRTYHLPSLVKDIGDKADLDMAAATMAKCTSACIMSLKESALLPTEEQCMLNCFNKSIDFSMQYNDRLAYTMRQLNL